MTQYRKSPSNLDQNSIPAPIYIALVDSLYQEGRSLFVGYVMVMGAMALTCAKSHQPSYLGCALVFTAISFLRALDMRAYRSARSRITTKLMAQRWEHRYGAGVVSTLLTLGVWCWLSASYPRDSYSLMVSFSTTIAYVIGITGRNFGTRRLVAFQVLSVAVPMLGALLFYGDSYQRAFTPILALFFVGLAFICERLRKNLLDAVISSSDMTLLANRFDAALTSMPHGLCMFDKGRRVLVANSRMNDHLGLSSDIELKALSAQELTAACTGSGVLAHADAARLAAVLRKDMPQQEELKMDLQDGRVIEASIKPLEDGGVLLLISDITERSRAQSIIDKMAKFDAVTGLFNRTVLQKKLEGRACQPWAGNFAIHYLDLDQFKQVNDTLGHSTGDRLLKIAAERLSSAIASDDVIARFGGDEFVVLQWRVVGPEDATELAEKMLQSLRLPCVIDGRRLTVSATIGIALSNSEGDSESFLRRADLALYSAKARSRDSYQLFKPEMELRACARRNFELDLRSALTRDEFEVYYQPIVEVQTQRVLGCEALLRWHHPQRGMVSPAEFIPVAEERGLIAELDGWVLRRACFECQRWPSTLRVAVNLSSLTFANIDVPSMVEAALRAAQLAPDRLEIEITETVLLEDSDRTHAALQALRRLGVHICLDDFGTNYSSLSYLRRFPLNKVKIDQSFVRDLGEGNTLILLRGISRLCAELGLRVTVEGIETKSQLMLVEAEASIREAQGYLFGRPVPVTKLPGLFFPPGDNSHKVA